MGLFYHVYCVVVQDDDDDDEQIHFFKKVNHRHFMGLFYRAYRVVVTRFVNERKIEWLFVIKKGF